MSVGPLFLWFIVGIIITIIICLVGSRLQVKGGVFRPGTEWYHFVGGLFGFICFGVLAMVMITDGGIDVWRLITSGNATTGTIHKFEACRRTYRLYIDFVDAGGKNHISKTRCDWTYSPDSFKGAYVMIRYLPDNPDIVEVENNLSLSANARAFSIGALCAAAFVLLALAWPALTRKKARAYPKKEPVIRSRPITPMKKRHVTRPKKKSSVRSRG